MILELPETLRDAGLDVSEAVEGGGHKVFFSVLEDRVGSCRGCNRCNPCGVEASKGKSAGHNTLS